MLYIPINNFSVMSRWFPVFLGWTSTNEESSSSVEECLTRDLGVVGSSLTGGTGVPEQDTLSSALIVLVQPRKTHHNMTEKLLTGM